jgi:AraC family transcriptional regulator
MVLRQGQFFGKTKRSSAICGAVLTDASYEANAIIPKHTHREAYFCLIRAGGYQERCGATNFERRPRSVVFHPDGEEHSERMGTSSVLSFNVELNAQWVRRARAFQRPWCDTGGPVTDLAAQLFRELSSPDDLTPLAVECLLLEIAVTVERVKRFATGTSTLSHACTVLTSRYRESVRMQEIAKELNIHPGHLARLFREQLHTSPTVFLRRLRVKEAQRLLSSTDQTIAEIAAAVGFSDQSHLTREFRRSFGTTPRVFRHSSR